MTRETVYAAGGTVQASGGIYIERAADRLLLDLCRRNSFCYVLTSRQVGKSSLMVRTAERLIETGCRAVILDLTTIGVATTADAWYRSILLEVTSQLGLTIDIPSWWTAQSAFSVTHRFTLFFQHVTNVIKSQVVIFVDEIDSTLTLTFTDDFFAAVRALHNARAMQQDLARLSFVLLGVATPSQLVHDPTRTPFNLGERVELTDFSAVEARPLTDGLNLNPEDAATLLHTVLEWTGGHPYLTLRTFRSLNAAPIAVVSKPAIEERIRDLFFGQDAQADTNLQFVREMLTVRAGTDARSVLETYHKVWSGGDLPDQERDPVVSWLKLSGIVKPVDGRLRVRNRIYREAFGAEWVRKSLPVAAGQPEVAYAVGGTVQAARGAYVERRADARLLYCCRNGKPAHILAPRQMGKSSLVVRTAETLSQEGFSPVVIDLSQFGMELSAERWHLAVAQAIADQLVLSVDITRWWNDDSTTHTVGNRFVSFLTDVVMNQVRDRVVIFIDEIDVTLQLPFRAEFFGALRSLYRARATAPQLERLNVILLGFGRPEDFVGDPALSPFTTSESIELTDYTLEEANTLASGLDLPFDLASDVLRVVIEQTGGHPYLTSKTFASLQRLPLREWTVEAVTDRVLSLFVGGDEEMDPHIRLVASALVADTQRETAPVLLESLLKVWTGEALDSDAGVTPQLKTLGVVKAIGGRLVFRNRVYEDVFNPDWIFDKLNIPSSAAALSVPWYRTKLLLYGLVCGVVLVYFLLR